jgi:hypothetical protein
MHGIVELSSLDLRYEGHRQRDNAREARLLASIAERGIEEPLCGVDTPAARLLLDGFKRCRSAKKLAMACVPYLSLGGEEATGILKLMRASTDKGLGILEQARFVVDLVSIHGMSVAEVAQTLSRSKGWVSMRRSLLDEMSPAIQAILFRGGFPVYSYMYTLRPFMRMNAAGPVQVERFVEAVAGQRLSVRDIELLARAYFRGPASLREAIAGGKLGWSLDQLKRVPEDREGCNPWERGLLRDLELLRKSIERLMARCQDPRLKSQAFYVQANLLCAGLLRTLGPFGERMKEFHDRSGHAECDLPVAPGRHASGPDQPATPRQSAHGADDYPSAGGHTHFGAQGQDPHRPGVAAAVVPRV